MERIQRASLRIILNDNYEGYAEALETTGLETLATRRQRHSLDLSLKFVKNQKNSRIFPLNPVNNDNHIRKKYIFKVNHARKIQKVSSTLLPETIEPTFLQNQEVV